MYGNTSVRSRDMWVTRCLVFYKKLDVGRDFVHFFGNNLVIFN